jgi:hypothetical protein
LGGAYISHGRAPLPSPATLAPFLSHRLAFLFSLLPRRLLSSLLSPVALSGDGDDERPSRPLDHLARLLLPVSPFLLPVSPFPSSSVLRL